MRAIAVDEHEQEAAERHAVKNEGQEADPPKQVHQEGNCQNSGDEGESRDQQLVGGDVTSALHRVAEGEHDRGSGGRDAEKERKARRIGAGEIQKARGSHGDAGTARPGNKGERLRASDHKSAFQRHVVDGFHLLAVHVGDKHQHSVKHGVPGHDRDVSFKVGDVQLLECVAEEDGRDGPGENVECEPALVGDLAAEEVERSQDKVPDVAPEIDEHGEKRAEMRHDVGKLALVGPTGQERDENEVAGGGNGQEFRDPLNHGKHDDLFYRH